MHRADMAMYEAKIHGLGYAAWHAELGPVGASPQRPATRRAAAPTLVPEETADVPTLDPYGREPASIAPAGSYQCGDPVWVHRHGRWHPGRVESASRRAVMAQYLHQPGGGTMSDTMGAECVMTRNRAYPQIDRGMAMSSPERYRDSA